MRFSDLVGKNILAVVPFLHETKLQELKLHNEEPGGLWVESQFLTDLLLAMSGRQAVAPKTPVFFLPFAQISFAVAFSDELALSETAFGLREPGSPGR